jgi:ABC-type polysaccharide/polyol phosphate export permease
MGGKTVREEVVAFILAVVAPPVFVHFSLLASAQVGRVVDGRDLKLADFRHLNILLSHLFVILWFVAGYALARLGEEMIATMAHQVYERARELCSDDRASVFLHSPRVSGYVTITFLLSQWLLSILSERRYPRGNTVGYLDVLLIWLIPALIYWVGTGIDIYSTFARYRDLYQLCGVRLL